MHYSDQQLSQFMEKVDGDTPECDLSNIDLGHLEECDACRARLSRLAGEGPWLTDWMDSVGDETCQFDNAELGDSSASVIISVEPSDAMHSSLQCETVQLDFLDDPTHPELLGRLGRYDIERLIGTGGFGIVFKARDSELNRIVAIKVLAPHLMHSGPAKQRFAREAQASAAVVHDHVVPIYDVVVNETASYFVMQYIPGESLQERVDRHGPLSTDDVLQIAAQMAAGLQAAHEQGLIHRDVKPGNVLLEDTVNRVMISDFGLARAADDASITRSGAITGTPHYMSPEQARGDSIDFRSDLFSLGSVIYFMATGRSPFRAPQMMAVLNRLCHDDYRPIEELNSQVPYELTSIVDRLLNKDPERRFSTAEEVHVELQQLLSDYQSGKLRPRRFLAPRFIYRNKSSIAKGLVAATLLGIAALGAYRFLPDGMLNFTKTPSTMEPSGVANAGDSLVPGGGSVPLATLLPPSSQRYFPPRPRGLASAGTLVGNAIHQELCSTIEDIERLEVLERLTPTTSMTSPWHQELHSISSLLGGWEQQLNEELNPGTTAIGIDGKLEIGSGNCSSETCEVCGRESCGCEACESCEDKAAE